MNLSGSIIFHPATLSDLEAAIALFKAASVPCSASVTSSAVPTLPAPKSAEKGQYETQWLSVSGSQRMRMDGAERAAYGEDREACAKARLDAMQPETPQAEEQEESGATLDEGINIPSPECAEWSAPED